MARIGKRTRSNWTIGAHTVKSMVVNDARRGGLVFRDQAPFEALSDYYD